MKTRGFTITEILVALAIFSGIAVPLTGLLHHVLSDKALNRRYKAVKLAQNCMEETLHFRERVKNGEHAINEDGYSIKRTVEGEDLKNIKISVSYKGKEIYDLFSYLYLPIKDGI